MGSRRSTGSRPAENLLRTPPQRQCGSCWSSQFSIDSGEEQSTFRLQCLLPAETTRPKPQALVQAGRRLEPQPGPEHASTTAANRRKLSRHSRYNNNSSTWGSSRAQQAPRTSSLPGRSTLTIRPSSAKLPFEKKNKGKGGHQGAQQTPGLCDCASSALF